MADLNTLGLKNENLAGASFDDIPENIGQSFADPPQPGKYRFRLPATMAAIWEAVESEKHGQRITAIFRGDAALTIVQSPKGEHDGEEFDYRVSNVPRERTKEKILVSDMDLILRALGETKKPTTNKGYAQALMKYAGKEFSAEVEFSWRCRDDKDAYFDDGAGGTQKVEGRAGCGARYYQRDVPKVHANPEDPASPLVVPVRITCSNPDCGASVRAFPNLGGFKK